LEAEDKFEAFEIEFETMIASIDFLP